MRLVSRAFFYAPPVPSPGLRDSVPTQPTALLQRYCCVIKNQLVNNCVVYIYYISHRVIHCRYIYVTHATAAFLCLRCAPRILYSCSSTANLYFVLVFPPRGRTCGWFFTHRRYIMHVHRYYSTPTHYPAPPSSDIVFTILNRRLQKTTALGC